MRVLTRSGLLAAGWEPSEVRRLRDTARLMPLRRGAYAAPDPQLSEPRVLHEARVRAAVQAMSDQAVVSHVSAAVLHGFELWRPHLSHVHLTRDRGRGGRDRRGRPRRPPPRWTPRRSSSSHGVPVTSPARTLVDLVRGIGFEQGVVAADFALRSGIVDVAGLQVALDRARGWPGVPRARRVAAFADARSESVGESRSRVAIARAGLPVPRPQLEVVDHRHVVVGRCDFGWEEERTVGEFDGRIKYGRDLAPDQDPGEAVFAEKVREDELRDCGLEVARWIWAELARFGPVAARIRRAHARGRRRSR